MVDILQKFFVGFVDQRSALCNVNASAVAVFDNNPTVISQVISSHRVRPMEDLRRLVSERDIKLGIVAVPADAAQHVTDGLIDAGVKGILNFAPVRLDVRDAVAITSVDFSVALERLAFQVSLGLTGSLEEQEGED